MPGEMFSCKGKVALVTGGRGLLGRTIAQALARQGARVYAGDIALPPKRTPALVSLMLDVTSEESVTSAVQLIMRKEGRLDILVNAAYPRSADWQAKVEQVRFSSWKENLNNQLGGYFLACRAAAQAMKKRGRGSIVNLGSLYGVAAPDFSIYQGTGMTMPVAYAAIKGGLISLTRYLAAYYAAHGIRVNCVSPGGVYDGQPAAFVKKYCRKVPLARMAVPADVAAAVVYLASDAASYVTGVNLMVDGGWTCV